MGFLNEQSLSMIVKSPRGIHDTASFSFPEILHPEMSMSFTQSGPLRKMVIAARFNVQVPIGWPELQIVRMANDGTSDIAFTSNTTEPKPTGYLNLYEYDLTTTNITIQVGDTLNIAWHGNNNIQNPRFSLAYYYNRNIPPAIPMVSIVVGDCDSKTDLLTLNTLYCEPITDSVTNNTSTPATTESVTSIDIYTPEVVTNARSGSTETGSVTSIEIYTSEVVTNARNRSTVTMAEESISTRTNTNQTELSISNNKPIIIGGTVVFSLLLILLFFFVVLMLVVKRRRKSASVNVIDPIEMSTQPRMLHNTPSKSANN